VRAYAVSGSFDDCHRLAREAFRDPEISRHIPMTSANSVNVGRLLPQMVYYFHAVAQYQAARVRISGFGVRDSGLGVQDRHVGLTCCTPSGNFGNLTAGLFAKRAGLAIHRFIAATNVNDVVPVYLESGLFQPRASTQTLANAMDVGHPSNFERMAWLYRNDVTAMRCDIAGTRYLDDDVRQTIRDVYARTGYLLDPHSAIGYRGLKDSAEGGIFLATAHPAKFGEIVEPIIGRPIERPSALVEAMARPRHIVRIDAEFEAVRHVLEN
jgi:threonine synthase